MDATIKGKGIANVTIAVTQDLWEDGFLEEAAVGVQPKLSLLKPVIRRSKTETWGGE